MSSKENQINLNLEALNIEVIRSVLEHLDIKFKTSSGEEKIPSIEDVKSVAKYCMEMALKSEDGYFEVGGFESVVNNGFIEIKFVLTKANALGALLGQ